MSKAFLITDMPYTCNNCEILQGIAMDGEYVCSILDEEGNERGYYDGGYGKPDWCPLKELPGKEKATCYLDEYEDGYVDGWNSVINLLCSEEDVQEVE